MRARVFAPSEYKMLCSGAAGGAAAVAAAAAARLLRYAPPHAHSLAVRAARASLHTVAHVRVAARAPAPSALGAAPAAWPLVQRACMSYADVGRVEEFKAIRGRKKQEKDGSGASATPVSTRQMLSTMLHFLWPPGETGLRTRVVTSLGMLFAAKARARARTHARTQRARVRFVRARREFARARVLQPRR
jgi:hypothetical protein